MGLTVGTSSETEAKWLLSTSVFSHVQQSLREKSITEEAERERERERNILFSDSSLNRPECTATLKISE